MSSRREEREGTLTAETRFSGVLGCIGIFAKENVQLREQDVMTE
jgi:hypothetical protein